MKKLLFSLIVFLSQTSIGQNFENEIADKVKMGQGINTVLGKICADCVNYNANADSSEMTSTKPGISGAKLSYTMEEIENSDLLIKKLQFSATAKLGMGIFKGSASFDLYNKITSSKYSYYIYLDQNVLFPSEFLKKEIISDELKKKMELNFADFAIHCGNKFVRGRQTGGLYKAIVEIKSNSQEEYNEVRSIVKAKFKSLSGSGSLSTDYFQSIETVTKNKSTNVIIWRNGTIDSLPSINILKESFLAFPEELNDPKNRCIVAVLLGDYDAIVGNYNLSEKLKCFDKLEAILTEISEKKDISQRDIIEANQNIEKGDDTSDLKYYATVKEVHFKNLKECDSVLNYFKSNYLLDRCNWNYISSLANIKGLDIKKKSTNPFPNTAFKFFNDITRESETVHIERKDGWSRYLYITGALIDDDGYLFTPFLYTAGGEMLLSIKQCKSLSPEDCRGQSFTGKITTNLLPILNIDSDLKLIFGNVQKHPRSFPKDPLRYAIIEIQDK